MTTKNDALKAMMVMFNCFQVFGDQTEKQAAMEAYWAVLGELPHEKIIEVCIAAARGEIGDGKRLPPAAQLFQAACPRHVVKSGKPSPDWRPHQDRFLTSDGTLYITENNRTLVYSPEELREWGYALPKPPEVLNRDLLLERGVPPIRRVRAAASEPASADPKVLELIRETAKKLEG